MENLPTRCFPYRRALLFFFLFVALRFSFVFSLASETLPGPAQEVKAFDTPNDGGGSITITWKMSPDDKEGLRCVTGYEILRSSSLEGDYISVGSLDSGEEKFVDTTAVNGIEYYYKVRTKSDVAEVDSPTSNPVKAKVQFFNLGKLNVLVGLVLLSCFILFSIFWARKGKEIYVRPIAGLKAIDEAIGRATEMGKPVLFIPGIHDIDAPGTLAGMSILGRVAEKTAEYGTPLLVPCRHAMAMSLARQVVRESHMRVGHPETYKEDNIRFLTTEQFGYVAGVDGIMVREKPAANNTDG